MGGYDSAVTEPPEQRGRFIVLDGVDGCGKSTQAERLVEQLSSLEHSNGLPALHLREPGGTPLGERVRGLLLETDLEIGAASEALLFAACRRQMLDRIVAPALARGQHVVCERFHPSTFAYQSAAGGLAGDLVLGLLRRWAGEPRPDLELILDLEADEAVERRARAGGKEDRIESRGDAYMARVVEGYREYARSSAEGAEQGAVLVAANGSPDDVAARVREEVARVL